MNIFQARMEAALRAAEAATGASRVVSDQGYRTPEKQAQYYSNFSGRTFTYRGTTYSPQKKGGLAARPPGFEGAPGSRHQRYEAEDLGAGPVRNWVRSHAKQFGLETIGGDLPHIQIARGIKSTSYDAAADGTPDTTPGSPGISAPIQTAKVGTDPYAGSGLKPLYYSAKDHAQYQDAANAAADKYGVPRAVYNALIYNESGWDPKRKSGAGAVGIAQFEPDTAKEFGIDPKDPMAALDAGAKYLASLNPGLKPEGWAKAIGAYNGGPGNPQMGYGNQVMTFAGVNPGEYNGASGVQPAVAQTGQPGRMTPQQLAAFAGLPGALDPKTLAAHTDAVVADATQPASGATRGLAAAAPAAAPAAAAGVAPGDGSKRPTVYGFQGQKHMSPEEDAGFLAAGQKFAADRGADFKLVPRTIDGKTDNKKAQAAWVKADRQPGDPPAKFFGFSAGAYVARDLASQLGKGAVDEVAVAGGLKDVTQAQFDKLGIKATVIPDHTPAAVQQLAAVQAAPAGVAAADSAALAADAADAKTRGLAFAAPNSDLPGGALGYAATPAAAGIAPAAMPGIPKDPHGYGLDQAVRATLSGDPAAVQKAWANVKSNAMTGGNIMTGLFQGQEAAMNKVKGQIYSYMDSLPIGIKNQIAANFAFNPNLKDAMPSDPSHPPTADDIAKANAFQQQGMTFNGILPWQEPQLQPWEQPQSLTEQQLIAAQQGAAPAAASPALGYAAVNVPMPVMRPRTEGLGNTWQPMAAAAGAAPYVPGIISGMPRWDQASSLAAGLNPERFQPSYAGLPNSSATMFFAHPAAAAAAFGSQQPASPLYSGQPAALVAARPFDEGGQPSYNVMASQSPAAIHTRAVAAGPTFAPGDFTSPVSRSSFTGVPTYYSDEVQGRGVAVPLPAKPTPAPQAVAQAVDFGGDIFPGSSISKLSLQDTGTSPTALPAYGGYIPGGLPASPVLPATGFRADFDQAPGFTGLGAKPKADAAVARDVAHPGELAGPIGHGPGPLTRAYTPAPFGAAIAAAHAAGYGTTPSNMLSGLASHGFSMPNFSSGSGGATMAYKPNTGTGPSGQPTGSYYDSQGNPHSYDMGSGVQ